MKQSVHPGIWRAFLSAPAEHASALWAAYYARLAESFADVYPDSFQEDGSLKLKKKRFKSRRTIAVLKTGLKYWPYFRYFMNAQPLSFCMDIERVNALKQAFQEGNWLAASFSDEHAEACAIHLFYTGEISPAQFFTFIERQQIQKDLPYKLDHGVKPWEMYPIGGFTHEPRTLTDKDHLLLTHSVLDNKGDFTSEFKAYFRIDAEAPLFKNYPTLTHSQIEQLRQLILCAPKSEQIFHVSYYPSGDFIRGSLFYNLRELDTVIYHDDVGEGYGCFSILTLVGCVLKLKSIMIQLVMYGKQKV